MEDKDIKELQDKVEKLKGSLNKNVLQGIKPIMDGTVNTGDTTTDAVINDLRTKVNLLLSNISGQ